MTGSSRPELSERAKRVLNGYVNLSAGERALLKSKVAEVDKGGTTEALVIAENLQKGLRATLGPTAPGCPCCGR